MATPLELQTFEETEVVGGDFSLVIGGPFYKFLARLGIGIPSLPNTQKRIAVLVIITWLPLLALSLVQGLAFGPRVRIPLLFDYSVYGRFLVGLPLLIIAEVVIDPALRRAVRSFVASGLVQETELAEFQSALDRAARMRDSGLTELVLFVLACAPLFVVFEHKEWLSGGISTWQSTSTGHLSYAGWWFALVSTPIVRFIMFRWVWRMFVWAAFLRRISLIDIHLLPTHPDFLGGLGFLPWAQQRFGILFAAAGAVIAGQFANWIFHSGEKLSDFKFLILGFVVMAVAVVMAPLFLFQPRLLELKRTGLLEYGKLANEHMELFDRKWVRNIRPEGERLLGTPDISSQADLGNSYFVIRDMNIIPITKQGVILVALQASAPMLVLVLIATPVEQVIQTVLKILV
jgi:hypothetical protein